MRIIYLLLLGLFIFPFESCKKYPEDDKWMHLRSVKKRLCGGGGDYKTWVGTGAINLNTNSYLPFLPEEYIYVYKDGEFSGAGGTGTYFNYSGVFTPSNSTYYSGGKWQLLDKKNKLMIEDNQGVSYEYTIIKLDYDELWFQNDSILFTFEKKQKDK